MERSGDNSKSGGDFDQEEERQEDDVDMYDDEDDGADDFDQDVDLGTLLQMQN